MKTWKQKTKLKQFLQRLWFCWMISVNIFFSIFLLEKCCFKKTFKIGILETFRKCFIPVLSPWAFLFLSLFLSLPACSFSFSSADAPSKAKMIPVRELTPTAVTSILPLPSITWVPEIVFVWCRSDNVKWIHGKFPFFLFFGMQNYKITKLFKHKNIYMKRIQNLDSCLRYTDSKVNNILWLSCVKQKVGYMHASILNS